MQRFRKKCGVADMQRGQMRQTRPNLFHRLFTGPVKQSAAKRESPAKNSGIGAACGFDLAAAGCLAQQVQIAIDHFSALGYENAPSQHGPVSHARNTKSEEG
jgi:hypothetical protein